MYTLSRKQKLPISVDEAWEFLSNPGNLAEITPSDMGFEIHAGADKSMYPGQIIEYTVRPMMGIPVNWVTEITHVKEPEYFVDEQRFGPYAFWHHKHFILPVEGGVEMEDIVHYKLPFGFLGKWMHGLFIRKRLEQIFSYRHEILERQFGKIKR